jgi:hypothetical protein
MRKCPIGLLGDHGRARGRVGRAAGFVSGPTVLGVQAGQFNMVYQLQEVTLASR